MYQDKLASLRRQLNELHAGQHPDFVKRVRKLDAQYRERLRVNEIYRDYLLECVDRDYGNEKRAASREYEEKSADLRDNLLTDFEDKRKQIESERHTMELSGDTADVKPTVTRKLRRRPNDPMPVAAEKRRKPTAGALQLLLEEREIDADLKQISRGRTLPVAAAMATMQTASTASNRSGGGGSGASNSNGVASNSSSTTSLGAAIASAFAPTTHPMPAYLSSASTSSTFAGGLAAAANSAHLLQSSSAPSASASTVIMDNSLHGIGSGNHPQHAASASASASSSVIQQQQHGSGGNVVAGATAQLPPHQQLVETRIEDGKLLYERRWYHRGQPVYVEGKELSKFAGTVTAIGNDVVSSCSRVSSSMIDCLMLSPALIRRRCG